MRTYLKTLTCDGSLAPLKSLGFFGVTAKINGICIKAPPYSQPYLQAPKKEAYLCSETCRIVL